MRIFSADQIYQADKFTIEKHGINSDDLMERASMQIFNWFHLRMQGAPVKIHLFCGIGNNGGDGIALARHLIEHGYNIEVNVVNYSDKRSKDFLINLDRLKERKLWPNFIDSNTPFPKIGPDDIIVDAIFGIGLNREPDRWVKNLIEYLNHSEAFIVSVDLPSGIFMNSISKSDEGIVRSNYILSFQAPKLIFFLPENAPYIDNWQVLDIGLDQEFLTSTETDYELIAKHELLAWYIPRKKYSHKGAYGHSLIIGGTHGKIGAMILTAKACLHAGTGLLTAMVPNCGFIPMQTSVPEAMVLTDADEKIISKISYDITPTVIGIGTGMGQDPKTKKAFSDLLKNNNISLVIDADAINLLSSSKTLLKKLPPQSILTPHDKELERLIGAWEDDFDKLAMAKAFSKKYDCILVLKGAHTITIYKDKGYINTTGNPGMATAGSGDVLTGVITALVAQGYAPLRAAVFGVYLHGSAGDIGAEARGYLALTASDISEYLGDALLDLFKLPEEPQPIEHEADNQDDD
ncbi:NAD(P)H-hydrate dehydratase [Aurantibacter crassamenti]|uniref:NAD(P)H-hydrate dehydratase n=1 Tax=Aurantibacter crassamenti TaxID=1837375 RepID=UPI001939EC9F|nr:NAD(P)H-hydrate dehydratase [Aurantibacter crassamenti]MBM1107828.1 NAD(P)H-hydrate dehydratase [Aurantibacter crassamenti]